jgi:hypothetical protein
VTQADSNIWASSELIEPNLGLTETLPQPVPEPGMLALFAVGIGAVWTRRAAAGRRARKG